MDILKKEIEALYAAGDEEALAKMADVYHVEL